MMYVFTFCVSKNKDVNYHFVKNTVLIPIKLISWNDLDSHMTWREREKHCINKYIPIIVHENSSAVQWFDVVKDRLDGRSKF